MLSNYKAQCEKFLNAWIKKNTRYKADNFAIEDYQDFIADFQVKVINELDVGYGATIKAGSINKENEKYFKQADFKNALQHYIDKEYNKESNFQYLINEISRGEYGKYSYGKTILESDNTILYEGYCQECKGEGRTKCDKCQNGQVKCSAWGCKNGRVEKSKRVDGKTKKYYEDCSRCRGKGRIVCSKCDGSGMIKCKICKAIGTTTTIARILIKTRPSYKIICQDNIDKNIHEAITEWSSPELHLIAKLTRESLQHSISRKVVAELYKAQIPFAQFNVVYNGEKFAWFVYGIDLQILSNGDMLDNLLSSDLNALVKVANKSSWCDAKILRKSQIIVAQFMESEINKKIIEIESNLEEHKTTEDRISEINKKIIEIESNLEEYNTTEDRIIEIEAKVKENAILSSDYVKNTLQSFDKMAKRFCAGITLNYYIVAFIISFVVAFIIPGYGFLGSMAIFPFFIFLATSHKKSAFKKWWGDILASWIYKRNYIEVDSVWHTIVATIAVFGLSYFVNSNIPAQQLAKMQDTTKIQKETKVHKTSSHSNQIPQIQTKNDKPQAQTPSQSTPKIDYEQKFGKRIYLATKDDFVNMRNAPSGEIIAQIYKKDFESIMIYSFDTASNEKWLKVTYFPPNVKDERQALSGYIHRSQIDKNKPN